MIPTSTRVSISIKSKVPADADAVVVFATDDKRLAGDTVMVLSDDQLAAAMRLVTANIVSGKVKEIDFDLIAESPERVLRVYVVGLGPAANLTTEIIRQAAGSVMKSIRRHRLNHIALVPPVINHGREATGAEAAITGLLLTAFEYEEYKGTGHKKPGDEKKITQRTVTVLSSDSAMDVIKASVTKGTIIADSQNFARTIASRPGNDINPPTLAKAAQAMAKEVGLACRVMDEKEMKRLGMGGILAVGAGSSLTPPRMIVLEHRRGPKNTSPLLIVGKSITFDTGGISIKPADKMGRMIYDKCGGMTVLGVMCALAKLKVPVNVVGILTSAENHVSASAYRPGDILKMYNGVTVEVTNTDAEGRLVLGDALAWGIETFKPAACVDLATLTGGVVTALGKTMAGVMSNSDGLVAELTRCGDGAGEKIWRLPLGPDQRDQIKSDHADIVNSAGREAHPLQGGAFLSFFVPTDGSVPWAHLDIAGVADSEKDLPYYGKGATGWGVRTLIEWISTTAPMPIVQKKRAVKK